MSRVLALVGGQYGSEGKGAVAAHLADRFDVHVRTGGPNAGHTFYDEDGNRHVMQTIPCGWIDHTSTCVIGRGAFISLGQLRTEIERIETFASDWPEHQLIVDSEARLILPVHEADEDGTKGSLHRRIGSTGKGVGAARHSWMHRISSRVRKYQTVSEARDAGLCDWLPEHCLRDSVEYLHTSLREDKSILLEGAQGAGLSLVHGPHPFVTSGDTNAATLAADCGLPPQAITDVLLVLRTYPIRVHGNSGPLRNELTWKEVSQLAGRDVEERTTVTKLVRRIGSWDRKLARRAAMLNAPTSIALMFCDYLSPEVYGESDWHTVMNGDCGVVSRLHTARSHTVLARGHESSWWRSRYAVSV